jgi:predicted Zn-dependent protease
MSELRGQAGSEAARNAIASMNGRRVDGGAYRVVLGPQPVTELLEWVLMPSLDLGAFHANMSMFQGRFGQQIASDQISLYDDGSAPDLAASKGITDEGLPTGRVDIISEGRLTGLLANHYEQQRMLHDPQGREKLGVDPTSVSDAIAPRNGFRTGRGGGRNFESPPGTTPTNLIVSGRDSYSPQQLLELVGDGLYIGRIWYTYLVNGVSAGDFSGTVVGDSYIIQNGRLAAPIKPNTLRMNNNIGRVISSVLGVGTERTGVVRWSSDQVTWAPEIVVEGFQVDEIAEYMESVYS